MSSQYLIPIVIKCSSSDNDDKYMSYDDVKSYITVKFSLHLLVVDDPYNISVAVK